MNRKKRVGVGARITVAAFVHEWLYTSRRAELTKFPMNCKLLKSPSKLANIESFNVPPMFCVYKSPRRECGFATKDVLNSLN